MAQQQTRNVWAILFKNFINSLKPRRFWGDLKGTDHFGTKYYEIPPDPSVGRRKASRYFEPPTKEDFEQEIPAEWEAWLRYRRKEPPTEEEVMKNYALMQMKKQNAIEVDKKGGKPAPLLKGMETFPRRPEYEVIPGQDKK